MHRLAPIPLAALLLAIPAMVAPALAAPARPFSNCLRQGQVRGWQTINDQTLIVEDRIGNHFRVTLAPGCRDLKWPLHLGFTAASHLSCIGRNDFLLVPPNGADVGQRCLVSQVTPYVPDKAK